MEEQRLRLKVEYTEKDIEDWLFYHPKYIGSDNLRDLNIVKWIGRQYNLPSGIADLIGLSEDGALVVVEVKNAPINKAALAQITRYRQDLIYIAERFVDYPRYSDRMPKVYAVLFGPSIDLQTHFDAYAMHITVMCFEVRVWVDCASMDYRINDHREQWLGEIDHVATRPEWEVLGSRRPSFEQTISQIWEEQRLLEEQELAEDMEAEVGDAEHFLGVTGNHTLSKG